MRGTKPTRSDAVAALMLSLALVVSTAGVIRPVSAAQREDPHAGVTQNWDNNLPSAQRFTILAEFNNEAVRDNNTGLVWERSPSTLLIEFQTLGGHNFCLNKIVGNTWGWRLPSVVELFSVLDPSLPPPFVPGSVFLGVDPLDEYWSASMYGGDQSGGTQWALSLNSSLKPQAYPVSVSARMWCVRGPSQESVY